MKTKNKPPVIEVGLKKAVFVEQRGGHTNVIIRPSKTTLRGAAELAKYQYGARSQTYQSIACRLND